MVRSVLAAVLSGALGLASAASISDFSPTGIVAGVESVKVSFDEPVVAFGQANSPAPMQISCDDPSVQGEGRWLDGQHWTYVFRTALPAGVHCEARVLPGFQTLNAEPLSGADHFRFGTGGPQVMDMRPYGSQVDEDQVFIVRFNGRVQPQSLERDAYCVVEGLGEAVPISLITDPAQREALLEAAYVPEAQRDDFVHLLQCQRRLPAEAKVQLVFGDALATSSGASNKAPQSFDFTVRPAFKAKVSCQRENARADCTPVSSIGLDFNAPISAQAAAAVRLLVQDTERSPVVRDEVNDGWVSRVEFAGPFPENAELIATLPADLTDDAGRSLINSNDFPLVIKTAANPPLARFASSSFGLIERFAYVPAGGSEEDYPPSVPVTLRHVDLSGDTGRVRDYVVRDDIDVLHWYARLQRLESVEWTHSQLQDIMHDRAPDSAGSDERLDVRAFSALGNIDQARTLVLPRRDAGDELEVVGVPLIEPGFHVLEIESPRLGQSLLGKTQPMYVRSSALVTNMAVHVKRGKDDALVWVTSLDEGRPVPNAQVRLLDCAGKLLGQGQTDEQGVWHTIEALNAADYCEGTGLSGLYASARIAADHPLARGKADFSFALSSWNDGIEPWRFNLPIDYSDGATQVRHTVLDRSLFRQGETVSMKHYVRVQTRDGLSLPSLDALPDRLIIEHQGSGKRDEQHLDWKRTPSGGLSAYSTYRLADEADLGTYTVTLARPDEYVTPSAQFRVEDFKLPLLTGTLKIQSEGQDSPLIAASTLQADVQLSWLSGGAASGLPVMLSAVRRASRLQFPGYEDFSFAAPDYGLEAAKQSEFLQEDGVQVEGGVVFLDKQRVVLDEHGGARVEVKAPAPTTRAADYLFEASFADPNGQIQTLSQVTHVWPASVAVGLKTSSWIQEGQAANVTAVALQSDGKPRPGVQMAIRAVGRTVFSTRKRLVGGFYSYDSHTQLRDLGEVCSGQSDTQGLLHCSVSLDESGSIDLIAVAVDSEGRQSQAASSLWVTGKDELWFGGGNDDRIDIIPSKKLYAPGETAEFQVRMPFRDAVALVAIEREGVLESQVVTLTGADPRFTLPVESHWGPNVYVSVLALRGRLREVPWYSFFEWGWRQPQAWLQAYRDAGVQYAAPTAFVDLAKPAYRFGVAEIRVSDQSDALKVQVSTDRTKYAVRDDVQVVVTVTRPDGTPASGGQLAFAAVDEALLELAANPSWDLLQAMRQRRGWGVETATGQMQVVGRRHYGRKAVPAGGGGGKSPTRELLDTLLIWNPDVQLDEHGQARLTVPLNDALTSFRLVAIADHGVSHFGEGSTTIVTSQDLQLVSGLPQVVREGDNYYAQLTVRNSSDRPMRVAVTAQLEDNATSLEEQLLDIEPGQAGLVQWEVTTTDEQVSASGAQASYRDLNWRLEARELGESAILAVDRLVVSQRVLPAVPLTVQQATLQRFEANQPVSLPVSAPDDALRDSRGRLRGGLQVYLQSSLASGLPGVRAWFEAYPYTCVEQLASRAIGMNDPEQWQTLMLQLPNYLDDSGLVRWFPGSGDGDEVLTAYLIRISDAAVRLGWPFGIPAESRNRMLNGLQAFAEGRIQRKHWSAQPDMDARKLAVVEALARAGQAHPRMLESLQSAPDRWQTSALIDWLSILQRMQGLPEQDKLEREARQVILGRMLNRGTDLVFADNALNDNWWLMMGPHSNAAKLLLEVAGLDEWRDEAPRLAQGLMQNQQGGAWGTTTANLMGLLALTEFALHHESVPLQGRTTIASGIDSTARFVEWPNATEPIREQLPWPQSQTGHLTIQHDGHGNGWATLQSVAAIPVRQPHMAGYAVQREVIPVQQARPGQWSVGDVYRVRLLVEARADSGWTVVSDPIPAGTTILGSGLGRDSLIAQGQASAGSGPVPSYIERGQEGYRAYYRHVPRGPFELEYTVRLNLAGTFHTPPTRVESLYQPDVYGVLPSLEPWKIQPAPNASGTP